jgi:hypothetical protein
MRRLRLRNWFAIGAVPAVGIAMAVPAASAVAAAASVHATPVRAAALLPEAAGPTSKVIVFLKDETGGAMPRTAALTNALRTEEAPIVSALTSSGATGVKAMTSLPIVVASVSKAQQAALSRNPLVKAVIPDSLLPALKPEVTPAAAAAALAAASTPARNGTKAVLPALCGTSTNPLLEPEAISAINATNLPYDGAGVTVAYIAGPIDPTIKDFKRNAAFASGGSPAGSAILTPVDFTGDPAGTPNGAADESFLDASSIAAQPNTTYDLNTFVNSAHPLNSGAPCDIKLQGAAPGADVMGENVFSGAYDTTESNFIQAIDYAVTHGVKVINESFGANNFPDTALDATRLADDAAVAKNVTVVVSSGDAGVTSTIGSPSTDPLLISAGASTTFRIYQQATYGGINATTPTGTNGTWIDNNISSLSSGGFAMDGKTVDLVAPGDLNWAECSSATTGDPTFIATVDPCTTFTTAGTADGLEFSGGTSESAPLTAGAAADVIQAYAATHGGTDPTPALIKQILMSTATDISAPGDQQGAGLLNVLAAVHEAASYKVTSGTPDGRLLTSPNQIDISQNPGASTSKTISITNTGASAVTVNLSTRALTKQVGAPTISSFCLNPSSTPSPGCPVTSNTFQIWSGVTEVYQEEPFTVPAMTSPSRLNFSCDYPYTGQNSLLHVALIDPTGAYAGYSLPQGLADFCNIQVANPHSGTWTAVFFTEQDGATPNGVGTSGTIQWSAVSSEFEPAGSITPSTLTIQPAATGTATFTATSPSTAGDAAQSIVLAAHNSSTSWVNTIPVAVRTLVPVGPNGGNFSGVLTGGNGRGGAPALTSTYVFNVPRGERDLDVSAAFGDANDAVSAFLVDPYGQTAANSSSITLDSTQQKEISTNAVNVYKAAPIPGTWELVLYWFQPVSGSELSLPFNGAIRFNQVSVTSTLPSSPYAELTAGKSYTFDVKVKNTGLSPEAFFLDPRTTGNQTVHLQDLNCKVAGCDQGMTLPLAPGFSFPLYEVPTQTREIETSLAGNAPVTYDVEWFTGDPDLSPALPAPGVKVSQSGHTASLDFTSPEVAPGLWLLNPSEIGPYNGTTGAPPATASASFSATTQRFDTTVTPSVEPLWTASGYNGFSGNFAPVYVQPGKTATIPLTIKAAGGPGARVTGTIYLDDVFQYNALIGLPYLSADELASVPFSYKVSSPLEGYDMVGRDGGLFHWGYGHYYGSAAGLTSSPIIGMAPTVDHGGYYLASAAGQVYGFGDAKYHGSLLSAPSVPISAIATDATGYGYWLVDQHGHVSKFGDAVNYGSANYNSLHETVVGMAATPSGHGYWMVTADGNVLYFGDARFHGSPLAAGLHLAAPLVGIASTLSGNGYWLVGADGGIFAYGDAKFHGSMYGRHLNGAAVGMAVPQSGNGYWVFAEDGGVFTFGGAKFFGSLGASRVSGRTGGASANS